MGCTYYVGNSLGEDSIDILPGNTTAEKITWTKQITQRYWVAIGMDDEPLKILPGYTDASPLTIPCVSCYTAMCPHSPSPCFCGWVPTLAKEEREQGLLKPVGVTCCTNTDLILPKFAKDDFGKPFGQHKPLYLRLQHLSLLKPSLGSSVLLGQHFVFKLYTDDNTSVEPINLVDKSTLAQGN